MKKKYRENNENLRPEMCKCFLPLTFRDTILFRWYSFADVKILKDVRLRVKDLYLGWKKKQSNCDSNFQDKN